MTKHDWSTMRAWLKSERGPDRLTLVFLNGSMISAPLGVNETIASAITRLCMDYNRDPATLASAEVNRDN